jgi:streptogramin lyase
METSAMFSRFAPLAPTRVPDHRAVRNGRHHRDRTRARFQLEGLEDRSMPSTITGYTLYPVPSGQNSWQITKGPDGNLWFTEYLSNKIGEINPTTHAITEFTTPSTGSGPRGITTGPDGNIWFTEFSAGKLGMINPTTHMITEFSISPPRSNYHPMGITTGPDGNLWFTETSNSAVAMFNPTTHATSLFHTPTSGSYPHDITAGPDGNLWFTDYVDGKIDEINPTTHMIKEFTVTGTGPNPRPYGIVAGPDGNIWFTIQNANLGTPVYPVGMISPTTDAISLFGTPGSTASEITAGPDGNLWFTLFNTSGIDSISPTTDAVASYSIPAGLAITAGPDGNLWFTGSYGSGTIGVAYLSSPQTMAARPAGRLGATPGGMPFMAPDPSLVPLILGDADLLDTLANHKRRPTV